MVVRRWERARRRPHTRRRALMVAFSGHDDDRLPQAQNSSASAFAIDLSFLSYFETILGGGACLFYDLFLRLQCGLSRLPSLSPSAVLSSRLELRALKLRFMNH